MEVCQITHKAFEVTYFSFISALKGDKDDHRWNGGRIYGAEVGRKALFEA